MLPERRDAQAVREYAEGLGVGVAQVRTAVTGLTEPQLASTYRPDSFTVRQLVHHIADAHEQGLMRFRWGLTDDHPVIVPMNQVTWASLADYALPPDVSLRLLEAVNERWMALLVGLDTNALSRTLRHPQEGEQDLWRLLAKHEWHIRHHLAHIRLALSAARDIGTFSADGQEAGTG